MYTKGVYRDNKTQKISSLFVKHTKSDMHVLLGDGYNIQSAYWTNGIKGKCANNKNAQVVTNILKTALGKCNNKNASTVPFALGTASMHEINTKKVSYQMQRYNNLLSGCDVVSEDYHIELEYTPDLNDSLFDSLTSGLKYVELKSQELRIKSDNEDEEDITTRSLEEIGLEKDITWLKDKKYYVINDDETAERIFTVLDNSNCVIAYDTETTGLKMNIFSKINSKYQKQLAEYNASRPKAEHIKADSLVGIIFCVEDNVSYYFPVGNRKFRNLYETPTPTRDKLVQNFKAEYTVGSKRSLTGDMARYWRDTPADDITPDVILMERCRNILTTKHLVAHNGSFEWKVSYCYDIDINLCDDTMIMHQLMYKFRSTTSNRGEPSNLKYLTKMELGIDQLDLHDFFTDYKEDKDGLVKGGKKKSKIDFSYMDYIGSQAYAPADGDTTLQIYKKYKKDLVENHNELVYLYQIEVMVACAIGYMEFYGIKLDEERINDVCEDKKTELLELEMEFRKSVNYSSKKEEDMRDQLNTLKNELKEITSQESGLSKEVDKVKYELIKAPDNETIKNQYTSIQERLKNAKDSKVKKQGEISEYRDSIRDLIDNSEKTINLGSPAQVATLFFDELGIECTEEKRTVNKKALKSLKKLKTEDKQLKYPMVKLYSDWKDTSTLITKFFDKLPQFMFPGGFIFCSFGQISTATGRMSCLGGDTPVCLVGGKKAIKDVRPGDLVYCYDEEGDTRIKHIVQVIDQGKQECIELQLKNSIGETESLICTPDHKLRLSSFDWVEAQDLQLGDRLFTTYTDKQGEEYEVLAYHPIGVRQVYDLEIEECHNFIVNNGINVHNCSRPNAQQFCKAVTGLVIPRDNNIMIDADFSQIEYRTLVAMANEPSLIEKFKDPDSDYHTTMASLMFGVPYAAVTKQMRGDAKSFNFGIPYGMGFKSLAISLSGMSDKAHIDEAKEKYELYFKDQPNVKAFFDRVKESALVHKYTKTLWGRRRYYSFTNEDGSVNNEKKGYAQRQAGNAIIQGCLYGDTRIQTKEYGVVKIKDVVDKHLLVWDGEKWTNGDILYSGKKQKCIVHFSNGQSIICSPIHKFLVDNRCDIANDDYAKEGLPEEIKCSENLSGWFVKCKHLKSGMAVKINLDTTKLCIEDFENRFNEVEFNGYHKDNNNNIHTYKKVTECVVVESVEITDEWIDMYDVCNTDDGYYVADGIITHNTAADIFKISVARNFSFIRANKLLGKLLIINMVHDEQLMEIDCNTLNPLVCYKNIADNMQFKIDGFPPLFIGAGFGFNWKYAKGGDAEIHPDLCTQLCKDAEGYSLFVDKPLSALDVFNYFQGRVDDFRFNKVKDYLCDKKNWGDKIHPVIGSLLTGNFTYGLEQIKNEDEPEKSESDDDYVKRLLAQFIEKNNLPVKPEYFEVMVQAQEDDEEDKAYYDEDEEDDDDFDINDTEFALIDEDNVLFGASVSDLIAQFGYFVSPQKRVCGVRSMGLSKKKLDKLSEYLADKVVDSSVNGSMELCFLKDGNALLRTGIYVANIDTSSVKTAIGF